MTNLKYSVEWLNKKNDELEERLDKRKTCLESNLKQLDLCEQKLQRVVWWLMEHKEDYRYNKLISLTVVNLLKKRKVTKWGNWLPSFDELFKHNKQEEEENCKVAVKLFGRVLKLYEIKWSKQTNSVNKNKKNTLTV